MPRRNIATLEQRIRQARSAKERARAHYDLGVFHDNNGREAHAIPNYRHALKLGLDQPTRAKALAWLASSLFKTSQPKAALRALAESHQIADLKLRQFLDRLQRRIERAR